MNILDISNISAVVVGVYTLCLAALMMYGAHRYWTVYLFLKHHQKNPAAPKELSVYPRVTIQLPVYNEMYVVERLLDSVSKLDYPQDKLEIQLLDDSTDATVEIAAKKIEELKKQGFNVHHVRRPNRQGYKAGALNYGMERAEGEFLAIFDADFLPPAGFLKATMPEFVDPQVGMVQTRWGHINADYSLLTRLQSLFLDGHFLVEHTARNKSGAFFNFNGTAGIWRREAIETAGGWSPRTLTEDLDLSFRSQLAGWKFVYLPNFVCPAELPVDIHAFHTQQKRWTKGAIQAARHLLKDLWGASIPLRVKLEGTVHLTANFGYLLTVVISLLILPSLLLRHNIDWSVIKWVEMVSFFVTTLSVGVFYAVSQRAIYRDWKWRMRDLFALMSFGIGMCVNNAIAVWEGLFDSDEEFVRTPKYDITGHKKQQIKKAYAKRNKKAWIVPGVFACYSMITLVVASVIKDWVAMPFILLFVFGFSYVASLSFFKQSFTD